MKIYRCKNCGNIIVKLHDSTVPVVCCGEEMELLEVGVTDGAGEKHVPYVKEEDNKYYVQIGEVEHPMTEEHYIEFIIMERENSFEVKFLKPNEKPNVEFEKYGDEVSVYEYCNLHGLWKKDL